MECAQRASWPQLPEPPQLSPFDMKNQAFYSELRLDVWKPHPTSGLRPATRWRKLACFCLLPTACDRRWGIWQTSFHLRKEIEKLFLRPLTQLSLPPLHKCLPYNADWNNLLNCFVDRVRDIRTNITSSSNHHSVGVSCFSLVRWWWLQKMGNGHCWCSFL